MFDTEELVTVRWELVKRLRCEAHGETHLGLSLLSTIDYTSRPERNRLAGLIFLARKEVDLDDSYFLAHGW